MMARVRGVMPQPQGLQVKVPAMIVEELVGNQLYIIQPGEKVKQWIARLSNQYLVARIAQQPEEEAVGLARARGEKDLRWRYGAPWSW